MIPPLLGRLAGDEGLLHDFGLPEDTGRPTGLLEDMCLLEEMKGFVVSPLDFAGVARLKELSPVMREGVSGVFASERER